MPAIFDTLALPTDRSAKLMLIHPVTRAPLTDEAGVSGVSTLETDRRG